MAVEGSEGPVSTADKDDGVSDLYPHAAFLGVEVSGSYLAIEIMVIEGFRFHR